jgi:hypothetical protein
MLTNIDADKYYNLFPADPHPFISRKFLDLNKHKADQIIMLVEDSLKPSIGLVAGLKDGSLLCPFSAPFGGFHYSHQLIHVSTIATYIEGLKYYINTNGFNGIKIILPPNIYHQSFNAKLINCLFNKGFKIKTPDITSWVDLESFDNKFSQKRSTEYLKYSLKQGLNFKLISQIDEKLEAYELIRMNRKQFGRPIFMTFDDLERISEIWDVDYFVVKNNNDELLASAIFYQAHKSIAYAVFWGDNEKGRSQCVMNFFLFNLWKYYKQLGYKYIDISISSEDGIPNEGLLRFKEMHESTSSLRFTFTWSKNGF